MDLPVSEKEDSTQNFAEQYKIYQMSILL